MSPGVAPGYPGRLPLPGLVPYWHAVRGAIDVRRVGRVRPATVPRHARPVAARRWPDRLGHRGLLRGRVAAVAPQPLARHDPLAGPVPITEHCFIGDQIRVPGARCDILGCQAEFADPAALGEADNRARALAAGWYA